MTGHSLPHVSHVTFLQEEKKKSDFIQKINPYSYVELTNIDQVPSELSAAGARREIFTAPGLVTARRSILGPPAEGRPGPSDNKILGF